MAKKGQSDRPGDQPKVKGWVQDKYVETILVDGIPCFLCFNKSTGSLEYVKSINTGTHFVRPLERHQLGHIAYAFTKDEIDRMISIKYPKEELLDKIKEQIDRFIVASDLIKYLILGDILVSYCLEWISTLHYPFFIGSYDSGKSSAVHLARWLCYRCHFGEDIPMADIYNYLGIDEEGCGTIAEDEAQEIDSNGEKMRMYKSSYAKGTTKARILNTHGINKHQVYYFTFCPKWFAGESIPEDGGFRERIAQANMISGNPLGNIKDTTDEEKKKLHELRNMLLVWKVQNITRGLDTISTDLTRRNKEVWESYLRAVSNTKYYDKCIEVVKHYVNKRQEALLDSFEARIFGLVHSKLNKDLELDFRMFWNYITMDNPDLPGKLDTNGRAFYPYEYKGFSMNVLSKMFLEQFHAEKRSRIEKGSKITFYAFKPEIIELLAKKYQIESENA